MWRRVLSAMMSPMDCKSDPRSTHTSVCGSGDLVVTDCLLVRQWCAGVFSHARLVPRSPLMGPDARTFATLSAEFWCASSSYATSFRGIHDISRRVRDNVSRERCLNSRALPFNHPPRWAYPPLSSPGLLCAESAKALAPIGVRVTITRSGEPTESVVRSEVLGRPHGGDGD